MTTSEVEFEYQLRRKNNPGLSDEKIREETIRWALQSFAREIRDRFEAETDFSAANIVESFMEDIR